MTWTQWRKFPDPKAKSYLVAPIGPGVYELRKGKEGILIGVSKNCASRMSSLLSKGFGGCGTRNNEDKRNYVDRNFPAIEYRTRAFQSIDEARSFERQELMKKSHRFRT